MMVEGSFVRIAAPGLEAAVEVYEHEDGETLRGLASLFEELARSWRGWQGDQRWSSLEGELTITATHDGLGTVELRALLRELESDVLGWWSASISVFVDAGALDELARRARAAS